MIVTCHQCDTSFQLDESRVPLHGIRVRCSRCKEAFFLEHPSAGKESLHQVAEEAAQAEAVPPPEATEDLPSTSRVVSEPDLGVEVDDLSSEMVESIDDEDEHDWEFNVDPSSDDDASEPEPDPGGPHDSGMKDDEFSGLSLEGEEELESVPPAVEDPDASAESAFGSVDDFSALMEEDESSDTTGSVQGNLGDDARTAAMSTSPEDGSTGGAGASEHLGGGDVESTEADDWDFFGDDSRESGAAATGDAVLGKIELTALNPNELGLGGQNVSTLTGAWSEQDFDEEDTTPTAVGIWLARAGGAIGWTITTALVVVGLTSGLWPTAETLIRTPQVVELGSLRAESVVGHWIDTARGETLLTLSGELRSLVSQPAAPEAYLQIALVGHDGRPLDVEPVAAGLPIPEPSLRELPASERWVAQDRAAHALARTQIAPGESEAFQAIFLDVPDEAARFAFVWDTEPLTVAPLAQPVLDPDPDAILESVPAPDAPQADASRVMPPAEMDDGRH